MSSSYGIRAERMMSDIRASHAEAKRAYEDAHRERQRLAANPDGTRGELSVEAYAKHIGDQGLAKVATAKAKADGHYLGLGSLLRDWNRRVRTFTDSRSASDAWVAKVRPLLDSGASIAAVVKFAVAHDDGDMLGGLHSMLPAWMAARVGGDPNDPQVSMAVREALVAVEQAQAQHGFIDGEVAEYRALGREAQALADESDAIFRLAVKEAAGSATTTDMIAAGFAVNAARAAAAGD